MGGGCCVEMSAAALWPFTGGSRLGWLLPSPKVLTEGATGRGLGSVFAAGLGNKAKHACQLRGPRRERGTGCNALH